MNDHVFLRGLTFVTIIGVLPEERYQPQPLVVDATLTVDLAPAAESGDLSDTVDYAGICSEVEAHCHSAQAFLLETLADELARLILNDVRIQSVTLRLTKPRAVEKADGVGNEITRHQQSLHG